jgi:hypothetical protein
MEDELFRDELKNIAPLLEKQRDKNPFVVPVNYFEALPEHIQSKITPKHSATTTRFAFKPGILQKLMVSSIAIVLLALVGYQLFLHDNDNSLNGYAEQLWIDEHMDWYAEYEADVFYDFLLSSHELGDGNEIDEDELIIDYLLEKDYFFIEQVLIDYD